MPHRDDRITLRQMLDHARETVELIRERRRSDLDEDRLFSLAILQLTQIVGESAARLSEKIRLDHPEIPWSSIIALRNRLIHGYDVIDFDILWQILVADLPAIIPKLERISESLAATPKEDP